MKSVKDNKYLSVKDRGIDGGFGYIRLPRNNKTGFTRATIMVTTHRSQTGAQILMGEKMMDL